MAPKAPHDLPGSDIPKVSDEDSEEASDKTNDQDRDAIHGDGDTIGMKPNEGVEAK
ncbi:hypothetical protein [Mesorhizobium sp. ES1-1]|uniref:hypothetical protein n=1 Tax=Mesorhizobium sp. ES1-1 TaxID=2876629 RepID=UPI001CCD3BCA|nr:hypothetical protein [Mesorhizobium sp. ES1-1]MBZ9678228.1 hypothetical protein [Mesorhizobium sp. ES1-1]